MCRTASRCRHDHGPARDQISALEGVAGLSFAVRCEQRVGARELHQVDRQAVAVRHRRLLDRLPRLGRAQAARDLARESGSRRRAESRIGERPPERLRRQAQRDLGGAHVRRLLDHLLDCQRAVGMRVVNRVRADRERARRRLDHRVRPHRAALERRRDGKGLQRRARLEDVGSALVAHLLARDLRALILGRPVAGAKSPVRASGFRAARWLGSLDRRYSRGRRGI